MFSSFFGDEAKIQRAQQEFYQLMGRLYELMGGDEAEEFMLRAVLPDPIIDWETGAELGDPCPVHPHRKLCAFAPTKPIHLECVECWS